MTQNKRFLKSTGVGVVLSMIIFSVTSCIDQLYDLSNGVSMDMELGGDSLAIPIGSTDTIRLGDYLDSNTISMLKTMEDGGYGITMKDSIEPNIPTIDQSQLKIDDQIKSISTPIDFGDINLDQFKIPGISVNKTVSMGLGSYSMSNFAVQSVSGGSNPKLGLSDYALNSPSIGNVNVNANQDNILSGITLPPVPPGDPVLLPITDPDPVSISSSTSIDYSVSVPDKVTNIGNVVLEDGAVFEVTIELGDASTVLSTGALVPNFQLDPNGLFEFVNPPAGGKISFSTGDSLTKANGYKLTKSLDIKKLNISGSPVLGKLTISKNITAIGSMSLKGASVLSSKIGQVGGMDLLVSVAVKGMSVKSMEFDMPAITVDIPQKTTNLNINSSIPSQIKKLNKVLFENPATLTIDLSSTGLPEVLKSNISIDNLTIQFPSQFVFEPTPGLSNNKYTITGKSFNPDNGEKITLQIKEFDLSDIPVTNNRIDWSGSIQYSGKISLDSRRISSSIFPKDPQNDATMNVQFGSSIIFNSAEVVTNPIAVSIPSVSIPLKFNIDMPSQVKSLGSIKMKEGTQIRLEIQKPEMPLNFAANNIQISFPSLFEFAPSSALLNNTLTLNGVLPDSIVLTLQALNINQELVGGKLNLDENINMSGGVELQSGTVNSKEIESLTSKSMSVKASTSDLKISSTSIQLNDLAYTDGSSIPLKFDIGSVPEQLVSLDSVILKDSAYIQLAVDITNMPNFGSPLNLDLTVDFPDLFLLSPGEVNNKNQLIMHESIVDGKLNKTLGIHGLKFDGSKLNGKLSIDKELKYSAGVSINSPKVNSDELVGKTITINVEAKIKNIAFKSVYGKLDPKLDPIDQSISLEGIPDAFKSGDIVLDITKPVIAISTECNLGIPIDANVKVTPLRGSNPDATNEQSFTLNLPKAPTPQDVMKKSFWISPDSAGMPNGADFKKTEVQKLFKTIPDGIKLVADITTDQSMQHFIDLTANYKFKLGYEVTVPLAFGKDLSIKIEQKLENIDPKIGEMAKAVGGIELLGSIENSIPLDLELSIVPLNANGERIAVDTVRQIISAGAHDGSSKKSPLTLKISDPKGLLTELRGFNLIFKATSNETVAGTPIKPNNFVKADLKVRVDGGINIKNLMDNQ